MGMEARGPRVSIIVPCYKVEEYLPRCLASLIGQTFQDTEVVAINDGSPDRCIDILHEWQERYPDRITVVDKKNEGVWRGRLDGIAVAHGEYIGFLDSDDYAEPTLAEDLYTAAKAADADVAIAGFSRIELETGRVLSRELCEPRTPFRVSEDPGRIVELNGAPWNKLFRASILKGVHDLPAPPPVLDDLMFNLLAYLDSTGPIVFVPKSLINYMVRSGSIIQSVRESQVAPVYSAFADVKSIYREAGASEGLLEALDAAAFLHLGISLNYRLAANPNVDIRQAIDRSTVYLDAVFPTWRHSPYIRGAYARTHGVTYQRLLTVSRLYKLGLLPQFLAVYGFVISNLHVDIKW